MNGRIPRLYTTLIRMHKGHMTIQKNTLVYILLVSLLVMLSGCGSAPAVADFPPKEETVQKAAEALGWTLEKGKTESWADDHVMYTLQTESDGKASLSCALVDGKRTMTFIYMAMNLTEEPVFAWEDWEKAISLAETLYSGSQAGELYKSFSGAPAESGEDGATLWEAESKAWYARLRWSPTAGIAEHNFPESTIQDWRETVYISLYPSKAVYENMRKGA